MLHSGLTLLENNPVLLLFLLLGLGYILGNVRVRGFSLGPVAGVLFAGIFFGHHGLRLSPAAQTLGFALFIFSVGYQAGPRFFGAMKADGLKYFLLSLTVALSALGLALVAAQILPMKPGNPAGLLAGGLTSSPTLAAAQDAVLSGTVSVPEGITQEQMVSNIASAYAITYIFGLTGLITLIRYLPRWLGVDLQAESRELEKAAQSDIPPANISVRWYRINNKRFLQMTVGEIREQYCERAPVATVWRNNEEVALNPDDRPQPGDVLELIGPRALFSGGIADIGEELNPDIDLDKARHSGVVVVTKKEMAGQTLGQLNPPRNYAVIIEKILRSGAEMPHSPGFKIQRGDVYHVVGRPEAIEAFGRHVGHAEGESTHTDMITFAFGIVAGLLLGMLSVNVGGISLGLGTAGGLLTTGLVIGYLRSIRPTFGRLPEATSWWLMEFGLLLFMAGVGLSAGGSFIATIAEAGPGLVIAGITITCVPLFVAYFVGSKLLRLNPAILMGALTGAMTSGASLSVVTTEARSAVPAIGYAGTYAFGNVLLMVAGPILLMLT